MCIKVILMSFNSTSILAFGKEPELFVLHLFDIGFLDTSMSLTEPQAKRGVKP